jgi:predicted RNA-binding protein YlxR (DUF448 family)
MESRAPQRTCIGCRRKDDQERFLRISRNLHGELSFSQEKQRTGRGAYVCLNPTCFEAALKGDRLTRALKQPVKAEEKEALKRLFGNRYAN